MPIHCADVTCTNNIIDEIAGPELKFPILVDLEHLNPQWLIQRRILLLSLSPLSTKQQYIIGLPGGKIDQQWGYSNSQLLYPNAAILSARLPLDHQRNALRDEMKCRKSNGTCPSESEAHLDISL